MMAEIAKSESPALEMEKGETTVVDVVDGETINAAGYHDQLQRQYGIWSLCGLALTIDNAWVAMGGSIAVAVYNGGPPGILYELIVAFLYYCMVGACIAELASAIPSAGGVYHWATIAPGPKLGRSLGFFTGIINFFGWIFDYAAILQINASVAVQLYAIYHEIEIKSWHTYVAYILLTAFCTVFGVFFNRWIPKLQDTGLFLVVVGGIVTIIVVAAMPEKHASTADVFRNWDNQTGWSSGVAFLAGVLNGAFTLGTVDSISHLAEELPNPAKDLPKAIALQVGLGFLTAFCFAIALLYGISDFAAVQESNGSFPLAEAYAQATGNKAATLCLLLIIFLSLMICLVGTILTCSRTWWALARDNVTPFPHFFSRVNIKLSCPVESMLFCSFLALAFGAITLGSTTAFAALAGSFIILTTTSYLLPIAGDLLTGRKNIDYGPFRLGKAGFAMQAVTCLLIIMFNVFFCLPFALPVGVEDMNYNSVILVGIVFLAAVWWFIHGRSKYPGPKLMRVYHKEHHNI